MEKREKYRQRVINRLVKSGTEEDLALQAIILRSKFSNQWGYGDVVSIGEAEDAKFFNTLLFHESAHEYLKLESTNEAEQSCYEFSKQICKRLRLPYDQELEQSCMEIIKIRNANTDQQEFEAKIENLPVRSKNMLLSGFYQG